MKRLSVLLILLFVLVALFALNAAAEPAFELGIREAWVISNNDADSLPLNIVINNPTDATYTLVGVEAAIGEMLLPEVNVTITPGLNVWDENGGQLAIAPTEGRLLVGDAFTVNLLLTDESGMAYDLPLGVLVVEEVPASAPFELILPWVRPIEAAPMAGNMGDMEATEEAHNMGDMEATQEAHNMGMGSMTAAYMLLVNVDESDHTLISASSPIAGEVQIHQTVVENDVARMIPQQDGLPIPANGYVLLAPGGYHMMLLNVTEPLAEGDAIPLTLTFDSDIVWEIALPVYDATFASFDLQFELEAAE